MSHVFSYTNSKGIVYFLHWRLGFVFLRNVKFGALDSVPKGYKISESNKGVPFLKKTS